jgi:4'-phosphopantetheinyl transferase EntD
MSTETFFDTNLSWESALDYEMAQDILGHALTPQEWQNLRDDLDDIVYHTVMSYQR